MTAEESTTARRRPAEEASAFSPEELAAEEWRDVVGYGGSYQVSNLGRVRGLSRLDDRGHKVRGRILKPGVGKSNGYEYVNLHRPGVNGYTSRYVHQLVLLAFGEAPLPGQEVRHDDGTRRNNRRSNLLWGTRQENVDDAKRHGTIQRGSAKWNAVLNEKSVRRIRSLCAEGVSQHAIARMYGVYQQTISAIKLRRLWDWVK